MRKNESKISIHVSKESFKLRPGIEELLPIMRVVKRILPEGMTVKAVLSDTIISPRVIDEQNQIVKSNIKELFSLSPNIDVDNFILNQLKTANDVVNYVAKSLGLSNQQMHDEVNLPDPNILRSIHEHLNRPDVDLNLSYQLRRQLLLALISARIYMRNANDKSYEFLSDLQNTLNDNFFYLNPEMGWYKGSVKKKRFITTHDPISNKVTNIEEVDSERSPSKNEKAVEGRFRRVLLGENQLVDVFSTDRKKGDAESILKAIARVKHGNIDPMKEIEDSIGKQFVVNGDRNVRDEVLEKYTNLITDKYDVDRIKVDDPGAMEEHEDDRGQSKDLKFKRVKIYFKGVSAPYEVICYALTDYINSRLDVGSIGDGGVSDGQAHALYELRRLQKVAKVLFPEELYGHNIEAQIELIMLRTIEKLRDLKKLNLEER